MPIYCEKTLGGNLLDNFAIPAAIHADYCHADYQSPGLPSQSSCQQSVSSIRGIPSEKTQLRQGRFSPNKQKRNSKYVCIAVFSHFFRHILSCTCRTILELVFISWSRISTQCEINYHIMADSVFKTNRNLQSFKVSELFVWNQLTLVPISPATTKGRFPPPWYVRNRMQQSEKWHKMEEWSRAFFPDSSPM